jgi:hypothetical protein
VTKVLSITSLITFPFQKVCGNFHVVDVIVSPMDGVHCNVCHSKSMIQKLGFLRGSITTNDELVLLTIEAKWLKAIVHMTKSKFLNLLHPKQVQFFISINIHGKICLSPTFALIGFQKNIQQFIPQVKINLKGEGLIALTIGRCGLNSSKTIPQLL